MPHQPKEDPVNKPPGQRGEDAYNRMLLEKDRLQKDMDFYEFHGSWPLPDATKPTEETVKDTLHSFNIEVADNNGYIVRVKFKRWHSNAKKLYNMVEKTYAVSDANEALSVINNLLFDNSEEHF